MSTNYFTVILALALLPTFLFGQASSKFYKMDAYISAGKYNATMYNFPPKVPSVVAERTLTAGVGATLTFSAAMGGCPRGVAGADSNHYLYISGGTGTAEAVLITGGTCTSGAASGTITFTPANNHSGSWAIRSATIGIQEAHTDIPSTGGTVDAQGFEGTASILGTITISKPNVAILFGACKFTISASPGIRILANDVSLLGVSSIDMNLDPGGTGSTIFDYQGTGNAIIIGNGSTVFVRTRLENFQGLHPAIAAAHILIRDNALGGIIRNVGLRGTARNGDGIQIGDTVTTGAYSWTLEMVVVRLFDTGVDLFSTGDNDTLIFRGWFTENNEGILVGNNTSAANTPGRVTILGAAIESNINDAVLIRRGKVINIDHCYIEAPGAAPGSAATRAINIGPGANQIVTVNITNSYIVGDNLAGYAIKLGRVSFLRVKGNYFASFATGVVENNNTAVTNVQWGLNQNDTGQPLTNNTAGFTTIVDQLGKFLVQNFSGPTKITTDQTDQATGHLTLDRTSTSNQEFIKYTAGSASDWMVGRKGSLAGNADDLFWIATAGDKMQLTTVGELLPGTSGQSLGLAAKSWDVTARGLFTVGNDVTLINGANNDVALGGASWVKINGPTAAYSITGFAGGTNGRQLTIYNTVSFTLTISNENVGSALTNRIKTLTGVDVVLPNRQSSASFIYDAGSNRWILVSTGY